MKRYRKIHGVVFILALLATGGAFSTKTPPALAWQLLPRVSVLDENKRNELREVLNTEPNYGQCREAILQCIFKEEPDKTAVRIANFCAYLLSGQSPVN